jgi:hypothetical protein
LPPGAGAATGPGAGDAPPAVNIPGGLGANLNPATAGGPGGAAGNGAAGTGGGFKPPNVLQQIVKDMLSVRSDGSIDPHVLAQIVAAVRAAERNDEMGPEFVGPWIPPRPNGHNGHH